MGLKANEKKTKFMTLNDPVYMNQYNGHNFVTEQ